MASSEATAGATEGPPSEHSIVTIPPELLERIVQVADPHDLLALRLVSREVHARIERVFVKAHFSERAFLLCSIHSLTTLLETAEHPVYGKSMRKVLICGDEIPSPEAEWPGNPAFDPAQDQRTEEQKQQHKAWCELQDAMQHSGVDMHTLAIIFARFRQKGTPVEVQITETFWLTSKRPARGYGTLRCETGRRPYVLFGDEARPVCKVLDALAISQLPITRFSVDYDNWALLLPDMLWETADEEIMRTAFRTLKSLKLRFAFGSGDDTRSDKLVNIIESITGLEELVLGIDAPRPYSRQFPGNEIFASRLFRTNLSAVKEIHLEGFLLDFCDLVDFLRRHPSVEVAHFCCSRFVDAKDLSLAERENRQLFEKALRMRTSIPSVLVDNCELCDFGDRDADNGATKLR